MALSPSLTGDGSASTRSHASRTDRIRRGGIDRYTRHRRDLTTWAGGFERINAYAYFAWLVVLAVVLLQARVSAPRVTIADKPGEISR
jgi:hypothetical protein